MYLTKGNWRAVEANPCYRSSVPLPIRLEGRAAPEGRPPGAKEDSEESKREKKGSHKCLLLVFDTLSFSLSPLVPIRYSLFIFFSFHAFSVTLLCFRPSLVTGSSTDRGARILKNTEGNKKEKACSYYEYDPRFL